MNDTEGVARRITGIMAKLELNGAELARSCDVSTSYISRLVRGLTDPTADLVTNLSEVHGVSPNWLLLGLGPWRTRDAVEWAKAGESVAQGGDPPATRLSDALRALADQVEELEGARRPQLVALMDEIVEVGGSAAESRVMDFLSGIKAGQSSVTSPE